MHAATRKAARTWGAVLGMAIMGVVCALPARAADETFDRTLPLSAGGSFALQNVNGSVTVTGWDRDEVEVRAVKSSPSTSTELAVSDLARVQVGIAASAGHVWVTTNYPTDEDADVTVTYTVRVPRRVWLQQVATVNGTVRVSGLLGGLQGALHDGLQTADLQNPQGVQQGTGQLRSVNGDVDVSGSAGPFSARTTNGDIHMELTQMPEPAHWQDLKHTAPMRVETVNGSIDLALPSETQASLQVRCVSGDFHSDLRIAALGAYTPRQFQGKLGRGGTPVQLSTVNGAIRIRMLGHAI